MQLLLTYSNEKFVIKHMRTLGSNQLYANFCDYLSFFCCTLYSLQGIFLYWRMKLTHGFEQLKCSNASCIVDVADRACVIDVNWSIYFTWMWYKFYNCLNHPIVTKECHLIYDNRHSATLIITDSPAGMVSIISSDTLHC